MERIKKLRKMARLSQAELATMLNIHQTAVSQWEQNRTMPDVALLGKLAEIFNVSIDYLLEHDTPKEGGTFVSSGIKIPVLGRVPAGIPLEAIQEILDYEEITPDMAATGEFFALVIIGSSMEPRMREGDVVIVRKQGDVTSGDTAVVIIDGHDATVKRLIKKENGIMLQATNPAHEPLFFTNEEIRRLPVVVLGRVIELRAKF